MKYVLCLIDSLGSGGAQRQLVGLASFLKERGYDVTVAFYHHDPFYEDLLKSKGVPYVFLKKAHKTTFRLLFVARYIRMAKPNVVISYLETPSICACVAKLFNRHFKLIVSERNTTQHTGRNERIRFNLFRIADYVVPNAYSQESYMRTNFPKLANKIVTIPNFVDLTHFVPPQERHRREIPEVMVAASIWASKNTLGFVDAVAALKAKGFRFHISWYGLNTKHIEYINQCKSKIERLGVSECIELKEKTTNIRERYQDADYFCLPSFYEGTPNVICEAMACGLPIVCSDVCDNSKYVIEGENGFLFNPKDTNSIVAAFERLLSLSDDGYYSCCFRSRALAERRLSKETFINAYINLLEK